MDPELEFWNEDAARINELAKAAKDLGVQVNVDDGAPPALEEDGSLSGSS